MQKAQRPGPSVRGNAAAHAGHRTMSNRPHPAQRSGYKRSTTAATAFRNTGAVYGELPPFVTTMVTVEVTVLLFASVADKVGARRLTVSASPGDSVARVRDLLMERYPQLESSLPTLLYALNEEYVKESERIYPGATLALIPPVSGG